MGGKETLFTARSRKVDPTVERVFKCFPNSPPRRGEIVLVSDVRCRVTRCKVAWKDNKWTIRKLNVKPEAT